MCTGYVLPAEVFAVIRISKITRINNVDVSLMDDLCEGEGTLLSGLLKKLIQFYAWSNASGKKMRLGLSSEVDLICTPRNLTFLVSTS